MSGKRSDKVQATTLIDCHLIASGSAEGRCEICIWQKQVSFDYDKI